MKTDHEWLTKWEPYLKHKNVLELGCGPGLDTQVLSGFASSVMACDLTDNENKLPNVTTMALDHSKPIPFNDNEFNVVVASLCLHYFKWQTTQNILQEVSRVLSINGTLICRVNSQEDIHHGAQGHPDIEQGLYNVNGHSKRFFSQSDLTELFNKQWKVIEVEHKVIDRYELPKSIWELAAINLK